MYTYVCEEKRGCPHCPCVPVAAPCGCCSRIAKIVYGSLFGLFRKLRINFIIIYQTHVKQETIHE